MSPLKCRITLLNLLCRICGKEEKKCISIFSETGTKQGIHRKIRECLPINVDETDSLPKQICLQCLNKLEASWDLICQCREAQITIAKKLDSIPAAEVDDGQAVNSLCAICNVEVYENQLGIGCEGRCQRWHHCECVNMTRKEYNSLVNDSSKTWICEQCQQLPKGSYVITIQEKIKCLSENNSITLGESAVISLAPSSPPLTTAKLPTPPPVPPVLAPVVAPTPEAMIGVLPTQGMMANNAPVTYLQSPATGNIQQPQTVTTPAISKPDVYPEGLIQVKSNSKPVVYQQRSERKSMPVPAPRNVPKPMPTPKQVTQTSPQAVRRRALREGDSNNVPPAKRSHKVCNICNKSFPDEIIDHHISLHMRQSFFTCLDCNKNFRSEEAMSRHRCDLNKSINLDPDDEPIFV